MERQSGPEDGVTVWVPHAPGRWDTEACRMR